MWNFSIKIKWGSKVCCVEWWVVSRERQSTPEHSGEHRCFADTLFFCLTQSTLEHSRATILALAAPEALGALESSGALWSCYSHAYQITDRAFISYFRIWPTGYRPGHSGHRIGSATPASHRLRYSGRRIGSVTPDFWPTQQYWSIYTISETPVTRPRFPVYYDRLSRHISVDHLGITSV